MFQHFTFLLGLWLVVQIVRGLFLSMQYIADINLWFSIVVYICWGGNYGWLLGTLNANGASFFFVCVYIHFPWGIYFTSYVKFHTWVVSVVILFIITATAFLGYFLPWSQMSFWGATVSSSNWFPFLGTELEEWIWAGLSVDNTTWTYFFRSMLFSLQ